MECHLISKRIEVEKKTQWYVLKPMTIIFGKSYIISILKTLTTRSGQYRGVMDLHGKNAVITGASSGIGKRRVN